MDDRQGAQTLCLSCTNDNNFYPLTALSWFWVYLSQKPNAYLRSGTFWWSPITENEHVVYCGHIEYLLMILQQQAKAVSYLDSELFDSVCLVRAHFFAIQRLKIERLNHGLLLKDTEDWRYSGYLWVNRKDLLGGLFWDYRIIFFFLQRISKIWPSVNSLPALRGPVVPWWRVDAARDLYWPSQAIYF